MRIKEAIMIFLKGTCMGIVNVLPVSSGTISLIIGVFERFINSIKSLNHKSFKLLKQGRRTDFLKQTDFYFLITIVGGIVFGMLATSLFLRVFINRYEIFTWSFFIGLIVASVIYVMKSIDKVNIVNVVCVIVGAFISFILSLQINPISNDGFLYLVLCGIIGSIGMVVPGISGSHLMILMGNYELIVTEALPAITHYNTIVSGMKILFPFAIGALISIVSISYLLSWLMKKYRNITLSTLSGFMIGSLPAVYPWKEASQDMTGYIYHIPEFDGELIGAIILALIGGGIVFFVEILSKHRKNRLINEKM